MCSNPCGGPLPIIKISLFLLSIFVNDVMSTPKIITFLPVPPPGCQKSPCLSNPILYPEYLYLLKSEFLIKLAGPNKQFFSVGFSLMVTFLLIS